MEFAGKAKRPGLKLKAITGSVRQQTSCCQWANSSLCIAILTTVKREDKKRFIPSHIVSERGGTNEVKNCDTRCFWSHLAHRPISSSGPIGPGISRPACPKLSHGHQLCSALPVGFRQLPLRAGSRCRGFFVSTLWRYNTGLSHQYTHLLMR